MPPEQAYQYSTRVEGDELIVTWKITPGYYLYRQKMGVGLAAGADASVRLGEPAWPKGESHTDEYFGTQEIYRGAIDVPVALNIPGLAAQHVAGRTQTAGLCGCRPVLSAAEMENRGRIGVGAVHSNIAAVVLQVIACIEQMSSCRRTRRFG